MNLPRWIRTPDDMAALAGALRAAAAVAIDTEADSLHHYPGKLCLVQVCSDLGHAHLVDPLALPTLAPLAAVCADPATVKVLHAAENDLAYFKRLFGFTVTSLFDTALAARFLGVSSLGLDGLLTQFLGITPVKSRQKDDWSRRPLTDEQETYALNDVLHLIELRERLSAELAGKGRLEWVDEECAALAAQAVPEKAADPDAYLKLKGARELDRRGWAVLRELYLMREGLALKLDRPPFMIVGNESLVALAGKRPKSLDEILAVPGCSQSVVRRAGAAILDAVARGEGVPGDELPVRRQSPRPSIPGAVRRRAEALRAWRAQAAKELELDPGVLFPQRLIDRLAADPPRDVDALQQVDGVRRWRARLFGRELLKALGTP